VDQIKPGTPKVAECAPLAAGNTDAGVGVGGAPVVTDVNRSATTGPAQPASTPQSKHKNRQALRQYRAERRKQRRLDEAWLRGKP